jgi:hypothetical protein
VPFSAIWCRVSLARVSDRLIFVVDLLGDVLEGEFLNLDLGAEQFVVVLVFQGHEACLEGLVALLVQQDERHQDAEHCRHHQDGCDQEYGDITWRR